MSLSLRFIGVDRTFAFIEGHPKLGFWFSDHGDYVRLRAITAIQFVLLRYDLGHACAYYIDHIEFAGLILAERTYGLARGRK